MQRWMARQMFPDNFGLAPAMIAVLVSGVFQATCTIFHFLLLTGAGNDFVMRLNLWLVLVLAAAYAVWILVAIRRPLPFDTSTGFVLSACGLSARTITEFLRAMLGPTWRDLDPGTDVVAAVEWTRTAGLVAFAAGLTIVLSASVVAVRIGDRVPVPRVGRIGGKVRRGGVGDVFR